MENHLTKAEYKLIRKGLECYYGALNHDMTSELREITKMVFGSSAEIARITEEKISKKKADDSNTKDEIRLLEAKLIEMERADNINLDEIKKDLGKE